jgi:pimeloyl-ACP methyl ester carboxylesterase
MSVSGGNTIRHVTAGVLDVAYEDHGPSDGHPVVLLHGFPYDPRCYDDMAPALAHQGYRAIVPYLRGYGPTRFLRDATLRSGQQAALARDLLDFLDALSLPRAVLVGYDWGGRAACIVAALWPERVSALVSCGGYTIQDIAGAAKPVAPAQEQRLWYQHYFQMERGRNGLAANRAALGKLLWRLWSPSFQFDDASFDATASSFENPDFVDVVIHSYRHRFGNIDGDPAYESIERALASQPIITVPTISLCGAEDGVTPPLAQDGDQAKFSAHYERRMLAGIGHDIPREAPEATLRAAFDVLRG